MRTQRPGRREPRAGKLHEEANYVELLEAASTAANEAATIQEAAEDCLRRIGELTGWPIGHFYLVSPEQPDLLVPTTVWHLREPERFQAFKSLTDATTFRKGIGLPGRVLGTGRPDWITDVTKDGNFSRAGVAREINVHGGFAFPVMAGPEVVGVIEFYCDEPVAPDTHMLEVMAHVGTQLGRVVERNRAEEALRKSEMKFRSVAQSAADAIIAADSSGRIISWNDGAHKMFGHTEAEALGQPLTILMPERYRVLHTEGMERMNKTGEAHVIGKTVEMHGLRKNGSEFPLELSLGSWSTSEGAFYSGIIRDITERKRAEETIRALNEELELRVAARTEELNLLNEELLTSNEELQTEIDDRIKAEAAKEQAVREREELFFIVSHELKNPLATIKGNAQLLTWRLGKLQGLPPEEAGKLMEGLQRINVTATKMNAIISELLDFARLQQDRPLDLQFASTDLVALVRQVVSEQQASTSKHKLLVAAAEPEIVGDWDPSRMEWVVANLLSNAIKYNPRGGDVVVKLWREKAGREGRGGAAGADRAVLSVTDTGLGIPAEEMPYIFEWFRRAANVSGRISGAGIGLASVRQIVHQHGGTVEVESREGVGSTFTVRLPVRRG